MDLRRMLLFAGLGWLAGALLTVLMGFVVTPILFGGSYSLFDPVDRVLLGMVLLIVTPGALLGGIIGGRLVSEGGHRSQLWMAIVLGLIVAMPCGCLSFWYLGWTLPAA